jgi:hypothetical protein
MQTNHWYDSSTQPPRLTCSNNALAAFNAKSSGVWKAGPEEVAWSAGLAREAAGTEIVSAVCSADVVD